MPSTYEKYFPLTSSLFTKAKAIHHCALRAIATCGAILAAFVAIPLDFAYLLYTKIKDLFPKKLKEKLPQTEAILQQNKITPPTVTANSNFVNETTTVNEYEQQIAGLKSKYAKEKERLAKEAEKLQKNNREAYRREMSAITREGESRVEKAEQKAMAAQAHFNYLTSLFQISSSALT